MLSAAAALLGQNLPNYLLTWMAVMDSLGLGEGAGATALSPGVMNSVILGEEFEKGTRAIVLC